MKKLLLTLIVFIFCITTFSQSGKSKDKDEDKVFYPANWDAYASHLTMPPYGLDTIQKLIEKIPGEGRYNILLPPAVYASLSLREKFTYHMIHGESYNQNCSMSNYSLHDPKKLFAHLPDALGEYHMSQRQRDFFSDNRDSTVALMSECIAKDGRIGLNFKQVIVDINATEVIPVMIDIYNIDRKDHDILTVLMLLMVKDKYPPFLASEEYTALYGSKQSRWKSSVNFSKASETLIIRCATNFYNGLQQKN